MAVILRFLAWPVTIVTGAGAVYTTSEKINRTLMWSAVAFGGYAIATGKVKL